MKSEPVQLLHDALKFYSPSAQEGELANFLCGRMKKLGYSRVGLDRSGNAIGEIGHGSRSVLLCGHMDTVPGRLPVRLSGGQVHGRGAADAKSPLCALMIAGSRASDASLKITFAGVTREETDSQGIKEIIRSRKKFDYAIFGEPAGAERITIGYRGRIGAKVSVTTEGGHAGAPWAHRSAFDEFNQLLARLRTFEAAHTTDGDHFRSVSVTPTLLSAGSYHNVIPSSCEGYLDVRIPPGLSGEEMRGAILAAATTTDGVRTNVAIAEVTEAYEAPPDSNLVRSFQRAILTRLKVKPVMTRKVGTGDVNTFALSTGATCVTYGPGASGASHTDDESVSVTDYLNSISVLEEALRQLGRFSST